METILYYILLFVFAIIYSLKTIHYTHMFQLNSYNSSLQIKWLFKNSKNNLKDFMFIIIGLILSIVIKKPFVCSIILLIILCIVFILNLPHKAKKPLVYTKRVLRLLTTNLLVLICLIFAIVFYASDLQVKMIAFSLLLILSPFFLLLCNIINRPIETMINRYYINDAKKIINHHHSLTTIGVTGSYGKTSVKYMLGTLLEAKYNVLITPESYNTTLGVTKVIRSSLRGTHDIFVCEMGAKNVGEIKEICDIVHPKHGIITSIGPQHLESFKTLDNVKKTKFELAESLPENGKLFLNGEDKNIASYYCCERPHITYGLSESCNYFADRITVTSSGTNFFVNHNGESAEFKVSLIGTHNVLNLVGAIAICCELGIELQKLPPYAKRIQPVEHRLQLSKHGNITIIDDAYNSNPSGAKAALDVLSLFDGYKIMITPGMVELGKVQYEENYKFGSYMCNVCDFVILVGQKQTEAIYFGLVENGFDKSKIFVTSNVNEAINKAFKLDSKNKPKIVLLENDLPDNY